MVSIKNIVSIMVLFFHNADASLANFIFKVIIYVMNPRGFILQFTARLEIW